MALKPRKNIRIEALERAGRSSAFRRFRDLLRVSVREVVRKRRRYIGVVAAIALSTAGFIVIITMGNDLKKNFNNDLDLLGGATIINPYFEKKLYERQEWFRPRTMEAIDKIPGVLTSCRVSVKNNAVITWKDRQFSFNMVGAEATYWAVFSFNAAEGRLFDERDVNDGAKVAVVGSDVARQIFGNDKQAIGQLLSLDDNLYRVIGVLGGVRAGDRSLFVFLPITTAKSRVVGVSDPFRAYVRCATWDDVAPVAEAMPKVISSSQDDLGLQVSVAWAPLKQVQRIFWWVSLFIYSSIVATMILGGFGIWNIMMAAVVSRTREIGLKKAMGALDNDILYQFLFEAMCVTTSASLIGILLGRIGVEYMSHLIGANPPEGLFLMCLLGGLAFSIILGVGSGLYPSIRASRMQVVDAMRYE